MEITFAKGRAQAFAYEQGQVPMITFHQLERILLCGVIALTVSCSHSSSRLTRPMAELTQPVGEFTRSVAEICPRGWQVSASNNVITLRREAPVLVMGKVSNPWRPPHESIGDYFKRAGREIHYEVRLRFVPLLSQTQYQHMKTAREKAAARFNRGASGKVEYDKWLMHYMQCQVPAFFTNEYSIFVDRGADRGSIEGCRIETRFIEVYPPDAAEEIERAIKSLGKLFNAYPVSGN